MPRTVNYQIHLHGDELRIEAHNGPTAAHVSIVSGNDGRFTISGPIDRVERLVDTLATAVASLYETSGFEVGMRWSEERQRRAWEEYVNARAEWVRAKGCDASDASVPTGTTYLDGGTEVDS